MSDDLDQWQPRTDVTVESWNTLLDRLVRPRSAHLLYRGHGNYEWKLECSLARALRRQALSGGPIAIDLLESMVQSAAMDSHVRRTENVLLRAFMEKAESLGVTDLPIPDDRLGWWELMQHHGAPTRLLDWTRSPAIALWWALRHVPADDHDSALWILDSRNSWLGYLTDMTALDSEGWSGFLDDREWQNCIAEKAIAERRMVPLVIKPRLAVPRVVAQQSVMTLTPVVQSPTGFRHHVFATITTRVRIRAEWRPEIERYLKDVIASPFELLRDLDSVGKWLTEGVSTNHAVAPNETVLQALIERAALRPPNSIS